MTPVTSGVRLRTEEDAEHEARAIEEWYGHREYTARWMGPYSPADFSVELPDGREMVEVKDRSRFSLAFMEGRGLILSVSKVANLIGYAGRATPVILVRLSDAIIRIDARQVVAESRVETFSRERGAARRGDIPERCYVIRWETWEEVRKL